MSEPRFSRFKDSQDKKTSYISEVSLFSILNSPFSILFILLISGIVTAKDTTDFRVSGTAEVGLDIHEKRNQNVTEHNKIGKLNVDVSARPVKNVRAEFEFEYDHQDTSLALDKLFAQYNIVKGINMRFGYMKKSFGLEEQVGVDERYLYKRSVVSDNLDYFGFLDHDLTLQYRQDLSKQWNYKIGVSYGEGKNKYLHNYSVEYNDKKYNFVLAGIVRHYRDATTFASSLSAKHTSKTSEVEAEATFGTNPEMAIKDETEYIFGARVKLLIPVKIKTPVLKQIIPVSEIAYTNYDENNDEEQLQMRAGITLGMGKNSHFQWRNNYGVILRDNDLHRRRFSSEAVVIF